MPQEGSIVAASFVNEPIAKSGEAELCSSTAESPLLRSIQEHLEKIISGEIRCLQPTSDASST